MAARLQRVELPLKQSASAFTPFVSVNLKRPCAEYEVDEYKFVGRAFCREFSDKIGHAVVVHIDLPAARDSSRIAKAGGEAISARGGRA